LVSLEKLYAISDLHIGGPAGAWAFRESAALGWLIDSIAAESTDLEIGLLLNGDVFDFLAEPGAQAFSFNADVMLRRILADANLKPVVTALRKLVATEGRLLIVQIGNHDIELALPAVQEELLRALNAGTRPTRDRVLFQQDPEGWLCKVAGQSVLAVHGNQSDPWNVVDYEGLRAAAGQRQRGGVPDTNAGTTMVLNVINPIKAQYPFVDLLKPEGAPLMAVLQALDAPASATGLLRALGRLRLQRGSASELLGGPLTADALAGVEDELENYFSPLPRPGSEDTLRHIEDYLAAGLEPLDLVPERAEQLGQTVNSIRSRWALWSPQGLPKSTLLREALARWLRDDESFDPGQPSAIDLLILRQATRGIEVLLAGHTHLARELRHQQCVYINTGTWMRLLKLQDSSYLQSDPAFAPLWLALQANTLQALDLLKLDLRQRPVAVVDSSGARLQSVHERAGNIGLGPFLPGCSP
jgi:UDP-2,3-diacylglucosamine pyrophosphatase LpxH